MQIVYFGEDAAACKHIADEMERLSSTAPRFGDLARWSRRAYLLLRGRYEDALALYRGAAEPSGLLGALPAQSWFAAGQRRGGASLTHAGVPHYSFLSEARSKPDSVASAR